MGQAYRMNSCTARHHVRSGSGCSSRPVDNQGEKVDLTMAYVGTRGLFERAGFIKAADTDSVLDGLPVSSCVSTCVDQRQDVLKPDWRLLHQGLVVSTGIQQ